MPRRRYDLIPLDHDLGENHPFEKSPIDGRRVVEKLVASAVNQSTPIIIHSMNAVGRNEMARMLRANGFAVEIRPFAELDESYAAELVVDPAFADWEVLHTPSLFENDVRTTFMISA